MKLPHVYRSLLLTLLVLVGAVDATARWRKIYTNPIASHNFRAVCFVDEQFGIIGADGSDGVFVTRDGGQTWNRVMLPGAGPSNVGQILMTDKTNGYLTLDAGDNRMPILYRTTTGGMSWDAINLTGSSPDVYITPTAIIVTNRRDSTGALGQRIEAGRTYFSFDKGNTFIAGPVMMGNCVDFVDNNNGVMVTYRGHVWSRTTNGGTSWTLLSPADTVECWGIYAVKGTGTFFTAGEKDQSTSGNTPIPSDVRRSDDYGATWRYMAPLPFRTTGHIAGVGQTLYIQADNTIKTSTGLFRSKDGGVTWQSIGGPTNKEDTRFQVMGCRGEVIIAFDDNGGVWKTDDGGDGSMPQFQLAERNITLDSIAACLPTDTTVTLTNVGCDTIRISAARSLQSDPVFEFLNADGSPITLPLVIPPGTTGTVRIRVSHGAAGPIAGRAEIETMRRGVLLEDTVRISGTVGFVDPMQAIARMRFDSVSVCALEDTVVTLTNPGCQAIHLLSARLLSGTAFTLLPSSLDSIAPGGTKRFSLRFTPSTIGTATDSLIVTYEVFGVQRRLSIPISGIGKPDIAEFRLAVDALPPGLPSELEFGTLTRCDMPDTLSFTITNPGCTPMTIAPVQMQDSTHRQILLPTKTLWWQTMAIPASVKFGDTLRLKIRISPATLGEVRGFVRVTYTIVGGQPKDYFLPYHATIVRGAVTLDLPETARSFDSILFCAQKDIVVPVRNTGCDTMLVTRRDLVSSIFFVTNPRAVPYKLAPGATDFVTLRFIPSQSGDASGTLYIQSDADSAPNRVIPVSGFAIPTDTLTFTATTQNQLVQAGDTALVLFTTDKPIRNKGVNVITVVLAYNGDVMTPWPSTVGTSIAGARVTVPPEVRLGKMARQTINVLGTNMAIDSGKPVVVMLFHVTLSDSARTEFHIESVTFNNNGGNFSRCVLGSVVDSGTIDLSFQCGDAMLNEYLRKQSAYRLNDGIRIVGKTVTPDPVRIGTDARLSVEVLTAGDYGVTIFAADGRKVSSDRKSFVRGLSDLSLPTSQFASGRYHVQLDDDHGHTASADFIVTH